MNLPKEALGLCEKNLVPLKATKEDVAAWIGELGHEKEEVWRKAFDRLDLLDPRLELAPDEAMLAAKSHAAEQRLAAILVGDSDPHRFHPGGLNHVFLEKSARGAFSIVYSSGARVELFPRQATSIAAKPEDVKRATWTRQLRAVILLERLATGDRLAPAVKVLKKVAEGHPDAPPTKRAKHAHHRLTSPIP